MFPRRTTPEVTIDDLESLMASTSAALLDCREAWEYQMGHVPGALHIPLGEIAGRVGELPHDRRIMVICQVGGRSLTATDFLLAHGFEGAASVAGGTTAWVRSGRPIER